MIKIPLKTLKMIEILLIISKIIYYLSKTKSKIIKRPSKPPKYPLSYGSGRSTDSISEHLRCEGTASAVVV